MRSEEHTYSIIEYEPGHFVMEDETGSCIYDDLDDLTQEQRDKLLMLYNTYESMDWETAGRLIGYF